MSYQNFTPGKKSEARRIIDYLSLDPNNSKFLKCSAEELKKFSSQSITPNVSNAIRISQIIRNSVGGKTRFGNYYLGEPVVFNYLGRVEGQPGGSGTPLRNRF